MTDIEKFDLCKYAHKSLNYLTRMTDEKQGYLPYWLVKLSGKPAFAKHCRVDDAEIAPSWSKALTLIRRMLNTPEGATQEAAFRKFMMENFREDGLSYNHNFSWEKVIYSNMHEACWVLDAMVWYFKDTHNTVVKNQITKMVDALNRIATHKKGRFFWHGYYDQPYESAYFAFDNHFEDRGLDGTIWTGRSEEVTRNGGLVLGLMEFWEETGHEPALKLAGAMVNHIAFDSRKFGFEGHYIGHVHAAMWTVTGVLKYAIATNRDDLISWARDVFAYTMRFSTSYGWIPEYVNRKDESLELCETCCIADMIRIALLLAEAGYPEYWEDVDRFTRNHLVHSQLASVPGIEVDNARKDTEDTTWRNIEQRAIGAFSSGTTPNYFPHDTTRACGGCCGATGAFSLYYVWDAITRKKDETIWVNLLMDRETDFIDIRSELPREGKATLRLKTAAKINIRLPKTAGGKVHVTINGKDTPASWKGDFLCMSARSEDTITVTFDDPIHKTIERQGYTDYQVHWKGNTVLYIMPDTLYADCQMNRPMYTLAPPYNYEPSRL